MLGSITAQLTAAILAIRQYFDRHQHNIEWLLFSTALLMMSVRRIIITGFDLADDGVLDRPGIFVECSLGLVISVLFLLTVILTRRRLGKLGQMGADISKALDIRLKEHKTNGAS
jgi:hypothetical protein